MPEEEEEDREATEGLQPPLKLEPEEVLLLVLVLVLVLVAHNVVLLLLLPQLLNPLEARFLPPRLPVICSAFL